MRARPANRRQRFLCHFPMCIHQARPCMRAPHDQSAHARMHMRPLPWSQRPRAPMARAAPGASPARERGVQKPAKKVQFLKPHRQLPKTVTAVGTEPGPLGCHACPVTLRRSLCAILFRCFPISHILYAFIMFLSALLCIGDGSSKRYGSLVEGFTCLGVRST